jgi:hypothetical protein
MQENATSIGHPPYEADEFLPKRAGHTPTLTLRTGERTFERRGISARWVSEHPIAVKKNPFKTIFDDTVAPLQHPQAGQALPGQHRRANN